MNRRILVAALGLLLVAACGKSTTASNTTTTSNSSAGYGVPGDATKADQTIAVHIASSSMYNPASISVKPGETVVFKVSNDTTGIHELVLGDNKVQDDYEKMMMSMGTAPMTMPDHNNVLNIQPGATKELAWTFPSTSGVTVIYGSHEPGDYARGLKGTITVTGTAAPAATGPSTTMGMGNMTSTTMGAMPGMGDTTTIKP